MLAAMLAKYCLTKKKKKKKKKKKEEMPGNRNKHNFLL